MKLYQVMKVLYTRIFLLLIVTVIMGSCSTKKNTVVTRTFHNVTARYNIYFNGKESYKAALLALDKSYKDNYNEILPLYKYKNKSYLASLSGDMDQMIKKGSKVIKMHSLKVKPKRPSNREMTAKERAFYKKKEYCNWIDDSYLLIGVANFYKEDYAKAINSFQQVITQYPEANTFADAHIWLLKTYIESNRPADAKEQISIIKNNKKFPEKKRIDFLIAEADYYLSFSEFDKAIEILSNNLNEIKNKELKSRVAYILAQLNEKKGNKSIAGDYYEQVVKMQESYEMSFYAQINRALLLDADQNSSQLESDLLKMLKDIKNYDFQAQIYFALAKLNMTKQDTAKAIEYFKSSTLSPNADGTQKALSFLSLGDIYFSQAEYLLSGAYYDSTMNFLDEKYSRYEELSEQTRNLKSLIENLNTVQTQDSLQYLVKIPEKERMDIIFGIINDIKQKEAEEKARLQSMAGNLQNQNEQGLMPTSGQGGKWYFYNQASISYGSNEFKKKWGTRKLEDYWRRSDKKTVASDFFSENTEEENNQELKELTNKMPEFYLQNLPLSDSAINKSNELIASALFNAASIYLDKLNEPKLAADLFEQFISRFQDNELAPQTTYNLFLISKNQNDLVSANKWKQFLTNNYPESIYAQILDNPDFLAQLKMEQKQAELLYEQAFLSYKQKNYTQTIDFCNQAIKKFPTHKLVPKFYLLSAFAVANRGEADNYIAKLENIKENYSGTVEGIRASEILATILSKNAEPSKIIASAQEQKAASIFDFKPNEEHWVVFYPVNTSLDINRLRFDLFNLCVDNFSEQNLNVEAKKIEDSQFVIVKKFSNKNLAKNFASSAHGILMKENKQNSDFWNFFTITPQNFTKIKVSGDLFLYQTFYKKYYLSK